MASARSNSYLLLVTAADTIEMHEKIGGHHDIHEQPGPQ